MTALTALTSKMAAERRMVRIVESGVEARLLWVRQSSSRAKVLVNGRHLWFRLDELEPVDG